METTHRIFFQNSNDMSALSPASVDLVVTSPPYPMIQMWDEVFIDLNPAIRKALADQRGMAAFEMMHKELDCVWEEVLRLLKFGGLACINIGDATRTIGNDFMLYPNHSRILAKMLDIGFSALPEILWRKQTNAPNKFMGSGMLPAGAYVTLEHEHILILRKGPKREFRSAIEKRIRRESAIFWEERNAWYSDVWFDLKGTTQKMATDDVRHRSAAFPFEIPYRLINMFSVKEDRVLDPFLGTGTTMLAAIAAGRHSNGFEIEPDFRKANLSGLTEVKELAKVKTANRLDNHMAFVNQRYASGSKLKYRNKHYGFPVMTNQETELLFNTLESIAETGDNTFKVCYCDKPQEKYVTDQEGSKRLKFFSCLDDNKPEAEPSPKKNIQRRLFD
ncbi:MAG: site-specific DNA-methyltransferase [Deltaproteobacteria bacterium]|nr:MAG: site-specific DNA-methyltransferase [Deltaproteobacteria bacterium]